MAKKQFYYTFKPAPQEFAKERHQVTKLDEELDAVDSYYVDAKSKVKCTCPANYRASMRNRCKHFRMYEEWRDNHGADISMMYSTETKTFVNRFEV